MARFRQDDPRSGGPVDDPSTVPGGETKSEGPQPIGVPKDYTTPQQNRPTRGDYESGYPGIVMDRPPRYFDGDDYIPANWPTHQIWELQQDLVKMGFIKGTFTRNVWDGTTRNAYRQLLGLANAQGIDVDTARNELLSSVGDRFTVDEFGNLVQAGGGPAVAPLVTRTTDPGALRQVFRRAVIDMLGEGWSQDEINKMVAAYNGLEISRQTQAYNMDIAGEGGNIQALPSPEEFIESEVLKKDPVGVQSAEALDFTGEFMQLAGSPAWGVG